MPPYNQGENDLPAAIDASYKRGLESLSRFLFGLSSSLTPLSKKFPPLSQLSTQSASLARTCESLSRDENRDLPRPFYVGPLCARVSQALSASLGVGSDGSFSKTEAKRMLKARTLAGAVSTAEKVLARARDMVVSSVCAPRRSGSVLESGGLDLARALETDRGFTDTADSGKRLAELCRLYHESAGDLSPSFSSTDAMLERASIADRMHRAILEGSKTVRSLEEFLSKQRSNDINVGVVMLRCKYYALPTPAGGDDRPRITWADETVSAVPSMPAEVAAAAIVAVRAVAVSQRDKALATRLEAAVSEIRQQRIDECAQLREVCDAVRREVGPAASSSSSAARRSGGKNESSSAGSRGRSRAPRGAARGSASRGDDYGGSDGSRGSHGSRSHGRRAGRHGHGHDHGRGRRAGRGGGASDRGEDDYAYEDPYGATMGDEGTMIDDFANSFGRMWNGITTSFWGSDTGGGADGYYSDDADPYGNGDRGTHGSRGRGRSRDREGRDREGRDRRDDRRGDSRGGKGHASHGGSRGGVRPKSRESRARRH